MTAEEMKALHAETQKAFHELQGALTQRDEEFKKLGHESLETKTLVTRLNEQLDKLEAAMNRKGITLQDKTDEEQTLEMKMLEKHVRYGRDAMQHFDAEERKAFQELQTKALSESNDAKGGIFVPEDFRLQVIKKIPNFSNLGALVNRQNTSKDVMRWPTIPYATDDIATSGVTVTYEDETDEVTETDFEMGNVAVPVRKARALIKVSNDLLEDSAIDIIDLLTSLLAEAFGLDEDYQLVSGAGGKKPEGFMTNADIDAINNGHATVLQYNGLCNFIYGLPEQYTPNARVLMKRESIALLRQIKDDNGNPIWSPSMTAGEPSTLFGAPIKTTQRMPAVASAAKPMIYGDFKRLVTVADRVGMTIKRLDEKYAETDQVGFIARRRWGAKVTAPWAARKLNMA